MKFLVVLGKRAAFNVEPWGKFQVIFVITSCSRGANVMYGALLLLWPPSHEIWPYPGNTAIFFSIGDSIDGVPLCNVTYLVK